MKNIKYLILFIVLILSIATNAQKSCNFVTLNQVNIEDGNDTTISGYFRINDYLLEPDGSVKFGINAQFNPNSNFKYIKLYSDSLCNNYIMSLDYLISNSEMNKIEGNFTHNFNICDSTVRVFLKFRMFDFSEYIFGMDVELRSFVGIDSGKKNERLKVFPNPVTNILYINTLESKDINIQLFNSMGEMLMETSDKTIHFSKYPSGMYFLRVDNVVYKLIKR